MAVSRRPPIFTFFAATSAVPLVVAGFVALARAQAPDKARPTPVPASPAAREAPAPAASAAGARKTGPISILSFVAGRDAASQAAGSFVTDSATTLSLEAVAQVQGREDLTGAITWQVTLPHGWRLIPSSVVEGGRLAATAVREGAPRATDARQMAVSALATVEDAGVAYTATAGVEQDERDQIRQEYVDLGRRIVPARSEFLDASGFRQRFGRRFPGVTFAELNWSVNPVSRQRYGWILANDELVAGVAAAEKSFGGPLRIVSGFRNPWHQLEVHAPVRESLHQYGRAVDILVPAGCAGLANSVPNELDWLHLAKIACGVGARFVEPLLDCHPNSPSCHLHMDFREGPAITRVVTVAGKVIDGSDGAPVSGARVRLAGMPAVTGPDGGFALTHVLGATSGALAVEALGYLPSPATNLNPQGTVVALQPGPRAQLTASGGPGLWQREEARLISVPVTVLNHGEAAAQDLRLQAQTERNVPPVDLAPPPVDRLAIGESRGVRMRFRLPVGWMPTRPFSATVTASFVDEGGRRRRTTFPLSVTPPAPSEVPQRARPDSQNAAVAGMGAAGAAAAAALGIRQAAQRRSTPRPSKPGTHAGRSARPEPVPALAPAEGTAAAASVGSVGRPEPHPTEGSPAPPPAGSEARHDDDASAGSAPTKP
jgi:hypothetical protein